MNKIKVLVRKPEHSTDKVGEMIEIENSLEGIQEIIGGYIEAIPLEIFADKGIVAYCDEEGKYKDLEPCIALEIGHTIMDMVMGNVLFLGIKFVQEEGFVEASLTDKQIEYIRDAFEGDNYLPVASKGRYLEVPILKMR